ncbi:cation transporter [Malonomonas rubra]|uniref:cation transporter n=1 Tax=Malonomonas rubra TaxID=57040 RepID=UPI0026EDEDE5|nr:cation transporter [Malonomonas rubra]
MKLKIIVVILLSVVAVVGASVYAGFTTRITKQSDLALAELQVENMTCGACVDNITKALDKVSGVEKIDISVTTGIGKVAYDPLLVTPKQLTDTITEAGYPASVKQLLSTEQYHLLQNEETRLAANYVARIGDQLISRQDFEQQLDQFLKNSGPEEKMEGRQQALAQVWQTIMRKTLLLQAAEKNLVVVQPGEVELRIEEMQKGMPNIGSYIQSRYGSIENFRRQLKEDMVISRNIDQFVIGKTNDQQQRQQVLDQWYRSLLDNSPVIIYDPQLKQAIGSGGCGGSCC